MVIIQPPLVWNKAYDGIDEGVLAQWMSDFKRSHLPTETVYPRPGQIWETTRDCELGFRAHFAVAGSEVGRLPIPTGESGWLLLWSSVQIVRVR